MQRGCFVKRRSLVLGSAGLGAALRMAACHSAARYCVVTGGLYQATAEVGTGTEKGACTFPNGATCDARQYFDGACTPTGAAAQTTFTDPFAYCAAVGTIDQPDERFAGPPVPGAVLDGLVEQGVVAADTPPEFLRHAAWRCMDGEDFACHFGANLPCLEKADESLAPSAAMTEFCAANPAAEAIPAAVTWRPPASPGPTATSRIRRRSPTWGSPTRAWW